MCDLDEVPAQLDGKDELGWLVDVCIRIAECHPGAGKPCPKAARRAKARLLHEREQRDGLLGRTIQATKQIDSLLRDAAARDARIAVLEATLKTLSAGVCSWAPSCESLRTEEPDASTRRRCAPCLGRDALTPAAEDSR